MSDQVKTCSVEGCEKKPVARGWCKMHWQRWRRTGTTELIHKESINPEFCTMDGCHRPCRARGLCATHHQRWRLHGDPNIVLPRNPPVKEDHYAWKPDDDVDYMTIHWRLQRNDRAKNHRCSHCERQAKDWAYDHLDPDEKVSPNGAPYSTNPEHYFPLCRGCHKKFDNNHKLSQPAGASSISKE